MRTLFINGLDVGFLTITGGADNGLEGVLSPTKYYEAFRRLFEMAASDYELEEDLAELAAQKIENELHISVLNTDDHTLQDIDLFLTEGLTFTWRESYGDSPNRYIWFYRVNDPYGEFSNFYPPNGDEEKIAKFKLQIKGKQWKSVEHYFQAMKFEGSKEEDIIRNARTAREAAKLGREFKIESLDDWGKRKDEVMYESVFAKFTQNEDLKKLLLATGKSTLIEHTHNDSYWADGGDGKGKNMLGKILMKVREELRNHCSSE